MQTASSALPTVHTRLENSVADLDESTLMHEEEDVRNDAGEIRSALEVAKDDFGRYNAFGLFGLLPLLLAGLLPFATRQGHAPKGPKLPKEPKEEKDGKEKVEARTCERDSFGCTALHLAAHRAAADEVAELLHDDVDVDSREAWDETPLHMAARAGSLACCKLLLGAKADLNALNADGRTPILLACDESVCDYLLDLGAALPCKDEDLPPTLSSLILRRLL